MIRSLAGFAIGVVATLASLGPPPKPQITTVLLYPPIHEGMLTCDEGEDCRKKLYDLDAYIRSWEAEVEARDPWTITGDDYVE